MKPNKTHAPAALITSLFAVMALQAEEPNIPPKKARTDVGHREVIVMPSSDFLEKLGLNDDQKAKLKTVTEDTQKQRKAILDDATTSRQDKTAKLAELSKTHKAKVKDILTPEQFEKYQKHVDEHRPIRPDNRVRPDNRARVPNVG